MYSCFTDIQIDGEERTAIKLIIEPVNFNILKLRIIFLKNTPFNGCVFLYTQNKSKGKGV